jgi:hypothetical protein
MCRSVQATGSRGQRQDGTTHAGRDWRQYLILRGDSHGGQEAQRGGVAAASGRYVRWAARQWLHSQCSHCRGRNHDFVHASMCVCLVGGCAPDGHGAAAAGLDPLDVARSDVRLACGQDAGMVYEAAGPAVDVKWCVEGLEGWRAVRRGAGATVCSTACRGLATADESCGEAATGSHSPGTDTRLHLMHTACMIAECCSASGSSVESGGVWASPRGECGQLP